MANSKPADDVGITPDIASTLGENRNTPEWEMILDMCAKLKENRLAGESIRKSQIPKFYKNRYDVTNLYRYELSKTMRACYTLQPIELGKPEIVAMIVEVFWDHKSYDRRFGYNTS
jgi:hypothetical protein